MDKKMKTLVIILLLSVTSFVWVACVKYEEDSTLNRGAVNTSSIILLPSALMNCNGSACI